MIHLNRRNVLTAVAAVPAAAAFAVPALAAEGQDAELRRLWGEYLNAVQASRAAAAAHRPFRAAYNKEFKKLRNTKEYERDPGKLHHLLWDKHRLEPTWEAQEKEWDKIRAIVEQIRHAKAESLFGIGVKLSVVEDPDNVDAVDLGLAIDDARRDIAHLIGVDFIAAKGTATGGLDA